MTDKEMKILEVYNKYIKEIYMLKDINLYCSKKTITNAVLTSERTNESKIRDAVEGIDIQMGDKVYLYFDEEDKLKRPEQWKNDHNKPHMCERVWKTLNVFVNVLDMKQFPKFHLKKSQKELLPKLLGTV